MFGNVVLILFISAIVVCVSLGVDVTFALSFGAVLFFVYCLKQGMSVKKTLSTMMDGIYKTFNVLSIFLVIGVLTASWRMSGTIAYMIYKLIPIVNPNYFILATFLLCSMMSMMIGTSFGTVASMGVICMAIARSMGINELYVAGAIVSGIYLGDRTSPMSSSASLVCAVTDTELYENIKGMVKTAIIPFIITCILYFWLGLSQGNTTLDTSMLEIFSSQYNLNISLILPALIVIVLSLLKVNVKIVMLTSIISAMIISIVFQNANIIDIIRTYIFGYKAQNEELARLMNGGGLMSMVKPSITILISTTYFGVFSETDILKPVKNLVEKIAEKFTIFGAMIFTSTFTAAIVCNQSLAVMLTSQITKDIQKDKQLQAIDLENTAIIIPAMIPWNIAVAIPLATVETGSSAILYSFFTIILPIYVFFTRLIKKENI